VLSRTVLAATELVRRHHGHAMPRTGRAVHRAVVRALPDRADVELLPGIRAELDLRQPVELQSWWQGASYERPTTELLDGWVADADAFFDIGSNYGFFALRAAWTGCPQIHAFEPNPGLHARLDATARRNHLPTLHCHPLGLSDGPAVLQLQVREADLGHSSFGPRAWADGQEVDVRVVTFDAWRAEQGIDLPDGPRWVAKIDVEGFELRVLHGMAEALRAGAFKAVVVELNELTLRSCGASSAAVLDLLADAGYDEIAAEAGDDVRNAFFLRRAASPAATS
jgi:FkbM family methyltransferase